MADRGERRKDAGLRPGTKNPSGNVPFLISAQHWNGTMFALQASGAAEIRSSISRLPRSAPPRSHKFPDGVFVPGLTLHPSGALLYQPFLTGAPGSCRSERGSGHPGRTLRRAAAANLSPPAVDDRTSTACMAAF